MHGVATWIREDWVKYKQCGIDSHRKVAQSLAEITSVVKDIKNLFPKQSKQDQFEIHADLRWQPKQDIELIHRSCHVFG